jgi:hypothetical protein
MEENNSFNKILSDATNIDGINRADVAVFFLIKQA